MKDYKENNQPNEEALQKQLHKQVQSKQQGQDAAHTPQPPHSKTTPSYTEQLHQTHRANPAQSTVHKTTQSAHKRTSRKGSDIAFYGVLALCLTVIGVSGYALFVAPTIAAEQAQSEWNTAVYLPAEQTDTTASAESATAQDSTAVMEPSTEADSVTVADVADATDVADVTDQTVTVNAAVTPAPALDESASVEPSTATIAEQASIWMLPLDGEVIATFSGDALVYDVTMQDWRVHTGTDYAADVGERVYAMADGTVTEVYDDGMYGTCVTLSLPDDITATYKGLSTDVKVQTGSTVRAGDVIGTVGDSNYAEAAMASHIHVEMSDGSGLIDAQSILGYD